MYSMNQQTKLSSRRACIDESSQQFSHQNSIQGNMKISIESGKYQDKDFPGIFQKKNV